MTQHPQMTEPRGISSTSKMSFAVAAFAFVAAAIGLLVNHWMSGWMAAGGMAGIGLFYLAIGLLNLHTSEVTYHDGSDLVETSSHRLSDAGNVDDQAIPLKPEVANSNRTDHLAKSRN